MSREIEFRAWSPKWKKMLYNNDDNYTIDVHANTAWKESSDDECISLMQYTGLKDCKGIEIYEGDIIAVRGESWLIEPINSLERDGMNWGLCASKNGCGNNHFIDKSILCGEVIGNIHQHPNLLT